MGTRNSFGMYVVSMYTIERLKGIKEVLKENTLCSDSYWEIIAGKRTDKLTNAEESSTEEEEEEEKEEEGKNNKILNSSEQVTDQLSTQFFFTQAVNTIHKDLSENSEICDIIEFLYEGLERNNGRLDLAYLENLSNEELVQVFNGLNEKLSIKGIYHLCSSIKDIEEEDKIKYMDFLCTYLLLPQIIKLEEPSRLMSAAIKECVVKFPEEILKFIFVPILNVDLKDETIINIIVETFEVQKRSILILEYVKAAKELKKWHISMLQTLLSVKVNLNIYDKLIKLFSEKAVFFSTDKTFGKLVLSFLKANTVLTDEQKTLLEEVATVHETLFKRPIQNIFKNL